MTLRKLGIWAGSIALSCALCGPLAAFELGRTGINLSPPARGWKIEDHDDAALKVWHLRADDWTDLSAYSGLIAVTISSLEGDPWPDVGQLRDSVAGVIAGQMLTDLRSATPFALGAGRFDVAGEDFEAALDLGAGGAVPISARLLVIRTGNGALIVTAFSKLPSHQAPFAALFGANGILTASGPGAEVLNGRASPPALVVAPALAPPPPPVAPPVAQAPTAPAQAPTADPGIADLLQQMEGGFSGTGGKN
jgi:hypothetical protein